MNTIVENLKVKCLQRLAWQTRRLRNILAEAHRRQCSRITIKRIEDALGRRWCRLDRAKANQYHSPPV